MYESDLVQGCVVLLKNPYSPSIPIFKNLYTYIRHSRLSLPSKLINFKFKIFCQYFIFHVFYFSYFLHWARLDSVIYSDFFDLTILSNFFFINPFCMMLQEIYRKFWHNVSYFPKLVLYSRFHPSSEQIESCKNGSCYKTTKGNLEST